MQKEIIKVVDCKIFKEELELAKVAIPFASKVLQNKKAVAKLFGVHVNTISNWIKDGTLQKDLHYLLIENKIVFIPIELLKLKANPIKNKKEEEYNISQEIKGLI